ncbi:MAG: Glu-tRNA(Gln) amidotransferase subunit GatE [Conexivisphaerales archaeon]
MSQLDPERIRLKVGLEIHRQINSSAKLFCACPIIKEEDGKSFRRKFRPSESELGEVDPAALFEARKGIWISYVAGRESSCLVEADEEPPHEVNRYAIETAIMVCRILGSEVVDEIQVMRKMVIDGSNTTGFQRTMVLGIGGSLSVKGRVVGVQTVTLEEDAARILDSKDRERRFSLDRLGIPLIEVSLEPVTASPKEIEEIALALGRLLKATGRMEKGIGSVRQDINISVLDGEIIEVKGVQQLDLISKVVQFEAERLLWLNELAKIMKERGLKKGFMNQQVFDVSTLLSGTSSKIILAGIKKGERALAVKVKGMKGLLSKEPRPNMRLGKELADIARFYSLGGLFHSDELPNYGISKEEVQKIEEALNCDVDDAFLLIVGEENRAKLCIQALCKRIEQALLGAPAETRAAKDNGETRFIRPRPGSARMYPETDIPPIPVTSAMIAKVDQSIPPLWEEQVEQIKQRYSLGEEQAQKIIDSDYLELFKELATSLKLQPTFIATLLTDTIVSLRRDGFDTSKISEDTLRTLLYSISNGTTAKEASYDILALVAKEGITVDEAIKKLNVSTITIEELVRIIDSVIEKEYKTLEEKKELAFGALMGSVMSQVRGRIDGSIVSKILKERIQKRLKN